jgi:hypothetical protein
MSAPGAITFANHHPRDKFLALHLPPGTWQHRSLTTLNHAYATFPFEKLGPGQAPILVACSVESADLYPRVTVFCCVPSWAMRDIPAKLPATSFDLAAYEEAENGRKADLKAIAERLPCDHGKSW